MNKTYETMDCKRHYGAALCAVLFFGYLNHAGAAQLSDFFEIPTDPKYYQEIVLADYVNKSGQVFFDSAHSGNNRN